MSAKNVTPNPNFWLCECSGTDAVHTVFEMNCNRCKVFSIERPRAEQWLINQQAEENLAKAKAEGLYPGQRSPVSLPDARKKPFPTREEFELALEERLRIRERNSDTDPSPWSKDYRRFEQLNTIIKRYRHACDTNQAG